MSTLTVDLPPTGSISPSCTARSSLTCTSSGRSPISSRNSVPPLASTNLPTCLSVAPVKAPFSWPNRMLSTRLSGIAPQLTVTNGFDAALARALDGARDQFLADAGFALDQDRDVRSRRLLRQPDDPLHVRAAGDDVLEGDGAAAPCRRGGASASSASTFSALAIAVRSRSGEAGFTTKSNAPSRIADTTVSMPPCAVCTMTGMSMPRSRIACSTPRPSMPGMTRSSMTAEIARPPGRFKRCKRCLAALRQQRRRSRIA